MVFVVRFASTFEYLVRVVDVGGGGEEDSLNGPLPFFKSRSLSNADNKGTADMGRYEGVFCIGASELPDVTSVVVGSWVIEVTVM